MTTPEAKFAFGENWKSYAEMVDSERLAESRSRLEKLLAPHTLTGKSWADVGCGSGLHSVSALKLGASSVLGMDLDPICVETASALAQKLAVPGEGQASFRVASIFDVSPEEVGQFDVVYSWGVLHHTGDMYRAITRASALVKPDGLFVVALYGKTRYCGRWTKIKRWYVNASPEKKQWAEALYVRLFGIYLALRGKRLSTHIKNYKHKRGMDFYHDVRDWVGGYPYESISRNEIVEFMAKLGFTSVKEVVRKRSGLFGSGCDEYIFKRSGSAAA